ncbi:zinc finger protein RFP-like [Stegastes partitus]|uniref:Zinc finger protein RFP-like n=1 Tax=Stegastes partitus TaxID=144197 RepID=A0A9Y4NBF7_9TELE|nr:PREDICTED: zinc finger protein RFP-like [Stegastes partitus]
MKSTDERARRRDDPEEKEKTELEKHNDRLQKWAVELENIKEEAVSKLWLPTKQRSWKTGSGSPKYIPNSVWQWILSASVPVHLDAASSDSSLVVSPDRLQVREATVSSATPSNNSQGFAKWPCVMGDVKISAGRYYWEVDVSPNGSWRIGVMSELSPRSQKYMTPEEGYWVLWKSSNLWACTNKATKLERVTLLQHIGVYVDVEEGQVSFYDVERRVHIYTFSDTFRHSLIPLFCCLDGKTVLKIKPPKMYRKH